MKKLSNFPKQAIQGFTIITIWKFPLLSNLIFFLPQESPLFLVPSTMTLKTHYPVSLCLQALILNHWRLIPSLLILPFFRLNNSTSDLFSTVIFLIYLIAHPWPRSTCAHCSRRAMPKFGHELWSRRAASQTHQTPLFIQTDMMPAFFVTAQHCWLYIQCMIPHNPYYSPKVLLSAQLLTILCFWSYYSCSNTASSIYHSWISFHFFFQIISLICQDDFQYYCSLLLLAFPS